MITLTPVGFFSSRVATLSLPSKLATANPPELAAESRSCAAACEDGGHSPIVAHVNRAHAAMNIAAKIPSCCRVVVRAQIVLRLSPIGPHVLLLLLMFVTELTVRCCNV